MDNPSVLTAVTTAIATATVSSNPTYASTAAPNMPAQTTVGGTSPSSDGRMPWGYDQKLALGLGLGMGSIIMFISAMTVWAVIKKRNSPRRVNPKDR